jgi:GABA(A) receptor-associated protein
MEFYTAFLSESLEERQARSLRLIKRYQGKYPVIIDRNSRFDPKIDKHKFLIDADTTISQMMYLLRKHIHLSPEKAMYVFSDGILLSGNTTIGHLHHLCGLKYNDGFTYLIYSVESTFG